MIDEILDCLQQWETYEDKKKRRLRWSQGHAWVKKYALFGEGDAALLIYNDGAGKQSGGRGNG